MKETYEPPSWIVPAASTALVFGTAMVLASAIAGKCTNALNPTNSLNRGTDAEANCNKLWESVYGNINLDQLSLSQLRSIGFDYNRDHFREVYCDSGIRQGSDPKVGLLRPLAYIPQGSTEIFPKLPVPSNAATYIALADFCTTELSSLATYLSQALQYGPTAYYSEWASYNLPGVQQVVDGCNVVGKTQTEALLVDGQSPLNDALAIAANQLTAALVSMRGKISQSQQAWMTGQRDKPLGDYATELPPKHLIVTEIVVVRDLLSSFYDTRENYVAQGEIQTGFINTCMNYLYFKDYKGGKVFLTLAKQSVDSGKYIDKFYFQSTYNGKKRATPTAYHPRSKFFEESPPGVSISVISNAATGQSGSLREVQGTPPLGIEYDCFDGLVTYGDMQFRIYNGNFKRDAFGDHQLSGDLYQLPRVTARELP